MNQDEFTPLLDEWSGILDFMKSSPPGSTWRRIVDRARGPSINDVMHYIPGPSDKRLTGNGEKLTYSCPVGCN